MNEEQTPKRKAISYIRYSSLQQGQLGKDSTKRQTEALSEALVRWNLELDQRFIDKGKSGFHQKHIAKGGAMYELREMAKRGELKDKILVIEDWDRAGRMEVMDASPLLTDILNNGVDIVVGQYGGQYLSKDIVNKNPYILYSALDGMNRGHGESKRKRDMALSKWKGRMEKVTNIEPVALNGLPFWLANEKTSEGKCTGKYLIRKGIDELVEHIFKLYINGRGAQSIGNELKAKGVVMPACRLEARRRKNGNDWHGTFIQRLIKNRAVLGFYRNTESKIFPQIVSEELYYQANQKRIERTNPRFAGRKALFVNPYAGLCVCPYCGGSISPHRTNNSKSKKEYIYLECRESKIDNCTGKGIRYERFEESFKGFFGKVKNYTSEVQAVSKVGLVQAKIAEAKEQKATWEAALNESKDKNKAVTVINLITGLDIKLAELQKELEQETITEKGNTPFTESDLHFLKSLFVDGKLQDKETRLIIQEAFRRSIQSIVFNIKQQSYKVMFKGNNDAYSVQLLPNGFESFKNDTKMGGLIDFDRPVSKRNRFTTSIERAHGAGITVAPIKGRVKNYMEKLKSNKAASQNS